MAIDVFPLALDPCEPDDDTYYGRKGKEQCCYVNCPKPCQPLHLMCDWHAANHRVRNLKSMRRTRASRKVQLWLIE